MKGKKDKVDIALKIIRDLIQDYHGDTKSRTALETREGLEEISALNCFTHSAASKLFLFAFQFPTMYFIYNYYND